MSFKIQTSLCIILLFVGTIHSQTQTAPRSEVAGIPVAGIGPAQLEVAWWRSAVLVANAPSG